MIDAILHIVSSRVARVQRKRVLASRRPYKRFGWELAGRKEAADSPGDLDRDCPECGQGAVALLWDTWENVDTEAYMFIDHYWCVLGHMWTNTVSSYERARLQSE